MFTIGLMKTFPEVKFVSSSAVEKLPELLKYKIPDALPSVKNLVADFVLEQGLNDIRAHTQKKRTYARKTKKVIKKKPDVPRIPKSMLQEIIAAIHRVRRNGLIVLMTNTEYSVTFVTGWRAIVVQR